MNNMEKVSLPIKTKIAAWWMLGIGGINIGVGLGYGAIALTSFINFLISSLIYFFLPAFFLLRKKKWSWWYAIIGLYIGTLGNTPILSDLFYSSFFEFINKEVFAYTFVLLTFLPPFILLFLDRKDFLGYGQIARETFPIKTKIAAWWMVMIGIICLIIPLIPFPSWRESYDGAPLGIILIPLFILIGLLFLWPAAFILKRKKWSWYLEVVILLIILALSTWIYAPEKWIIREFFLIIIIFLPPLILLLLDRKNFWKIAS